MVRCCVRGWAESRPHWRADRDEDAVSEFHMDCCIFEKSDEESQPIFVVRDKDTRTNLSILALSID